MRKARRPECRFGGSSPLTRSLTEALPSSIECCSPVFLFPTFLFPTLDLKRKAGYLSSVRRHVRSFAKLVTLAFGLSAFAPFLLCGGGSPTKVEASACCRAMQFKCHKTDGDSACCNHQSVAPFQPAIASGSPLAPPQPLATINVLPIPVTGGALAGQFGDRLFDLFPAHS